MIPQIESGTRRQYNSCGPYMQDYVMISPEDYQRANVCVSALAGIENPEEFVKLAKQLMKLAKGGKNEKL